MPLSSHITVLGKTAPMKAPPLNSEGRIRLCSSIEMKGEKIWKEVSVIS